MEIGIDSFAARLAGGAVDRQISASEALALLLKRIELADRTGLDEFGSGEHHRAEFLDSAPAVILAAARTRCTPPKVTEKIVRHGQVLGGILRVTFQMDRRRGRTPSS